jgi:hypothetical protein
MMSYVLQNQWMVDVLRLSLPVCFTTVLLVLSAFHLLTHLLQKGRTPLSWAVQNGHLECVMALLGSEHAKTMVGKADKVCIFCFHWPNIPLN